MAVEDCPGRSVEASGISGDDAKWVEHEYGCPTAVLPPSAGPPITGSTICDWSRTEACRSAAGVVSPRDEVDSTLAATACHPGA